MLQQQKIVYGMKVLKLYVYTLFGKDEINN